VSPGTGRPISIAPTQAVSPGMPSTDTAWLMRPSEGSILCRPSPRGTTLRKAQSRNAQTTSPAANPAWSDWITRATTRDTMAWPTTKAGAYDGPGFMRPRR
jgi:hypothetical protein